MKAEIGYGRFVERMRERKERSECALTRVTKKSRQKQHEG